MFSKWFKQSPKIETVRKINPSSLPTQKKAGPIDQRSNQKRKELPEKMKAKKQSNLKKPLNSQRSCLAKWSLKPLLKLNSQNLLFRQIQR